MRIAVFFFVYYSANGVLVPYLSAYFRELGFSGQEIGLVASMSPIATILIPPVWGFLADRTQRPTLLLKVACFGAVASFAPLWSVHQLAAILVAMAVFAVFQSPISALGDTVAVAEARRLETDYARLRLWGSVGFIVASYIFGAYRAFGGPLRDTVPATLILLSAAALASLLVRRPTERLRMAPPSLADARKLAAHPAFLAFLLAGMLHWASASSYYLFFTLHLKQLGISPSYVGLGFALGVSAEVAMMFFFRDVIRRVPLFALLALAFCCGSVRWYLVSFVDYGPALAAIQMFHGLTFGAFYVGSIEHLDRTAPEGLRATARALFSSVVLGLGGLLGNNLSGWMYDLGGGQLAFRTSACVELLAPVALFLAARLYRREARPK
jgi:PPP family 3-phenylpropionic acid transporter